MLNSIRLRNLRGFPEDEELPFVKIKPLTVLVGKNSSGKSSFLRVFPLLRQSVEAKTTGPVLWYGPYVDYGSFEQAINRRTEAEELYFDFKIKISVPDHEVFGRRIRLKQPGYSSAEGEVDVTVSIGVTTSPSEGTVTKSACIYYNDFKYEFRFGKYYSCELIINGEPYDGSDLKYYEGSGLLPIVGSEKEMKSRESIHFIFDEDSISNFYENKIYSFLKPYFRKGTREENIQRGIRRIDILKKEDVYRVLSRAYADKSTFIKDLNKYQSHIVSSVYELNSHRNLARVMRLVNNSLEGTFRNIRYIAPLRATAERFYRFQDLRVDEIDHTGSNLAMLLRSINRREYEKFSKWTLENFGFTVKVKEEGLHYALLIKTEDSDVEFNINDMGFGFSQILPIVASLWFETLSSRFRRSRKEMIFAIEQPELHLHPEFQVKLAQVFARLISYLRSSNRDQKISIVFETHSKAIVDTLGEMVSEGILAPEDINVVLFDNSGGSGDSNYSFSSYDDGGYLKNWPIGFFSGGF